MPRYNGEHEDAIIPFVDAMRYKLAVNRHKGTSQSWDGLNLDMLLAKLSGEVEELREAISGGNCTEIMLEGADCANFAMIISHIAIRRAARGDGSPARARDAAPREPQEARVPRYPAEVADHQEERTTTGSAGPRGHYGHGERTTGHDDPTGAQDEVIPVGQMEEGYVSDRDRPGSIVWLKKGETVESVLAREYSEASNHMMKAIAVLPFRPAEKTYLVENTEMLLHHIRSTYKW